MCRMGHLTEKLDDHDKIIDGCCAAELLGFLCRPKPQLFGVDWLATRSTGNDRVPVDLTLTVLTSLYYRAEAFPRLGWTQFG